MKLTFFIGSYTEYPVPDFGGIGHGIYTVQLDNETGVLSAIYTVQARNPSYLAISEDDKFLYCHTELDESENPKVKAYQIKEDSSLAYLNEQAIKGSYPCHLKKYKHHVLVACYYSGNVLQFPLDTAGKLLPSKINYYHEGASINKARQEAPHAHQVAVHPNKKDIYVCDLGIDTIKAYRFEDEVLVPNQEKDCTLSKGGGPRHLVFNTKGTLAYVLNELTGHISVLENANNSFREINTFHTLSNDYKGVPSSSAIRIHPNGKWLYAANRTLEAITIFSITGNKLELIDYQYTKGKELREFNITPNGKWLIACHQNSHDTVVYEIQKDGKLKETFRTKDILSPVCIAFTNNMQ